MARVEVYDPPQGCSSGLCGPESEEASAQFALALEDLRRRGIKVGRFNLGYEPGAFVRNPVVKEALEHDGIGCLPLILVEDKILIRGGYPARDVLERSIDGSEPDDGKQETGEPERDRFAGDARA